MSNIDKRALREELSNPAIGCNALLRKFALALLDELEAKDKRNAELEDLLEAEIKSWMQRYDSANNRREAAEKRVAELEARQGVMRSFCKHQFYWDVSNVQRCARCDISIPSAAGKGE